MLSKKAEPSNPWRGGAGGLLTGRTRESFLGVLGMYRVFSWVGNMGTNMGKIFINITPTIDAALITSI